MSGGDVGDVDDDDVGDEDFGDEDDADGNGRERMLHWQLNLCSTDRDQLDLCLSSPPCSGCYEGYWLDFEKICGKDEIDFEKKYGGDEVNIIIRRIWKKYIKEIVALVPFVLPRTKIQSPLVLACYLRWKKLADTSWVRRIRIERLYINLNLNPLHPLPLHPLPLHPLPLHPFPLHPLPFHPLPLHLFHKVD